MVGLILIDRFETRFPAALAGKSMPEVRVFVGALLFPTYQQFVPGVY
jgi:hypothetical protein